MSVLNMIMFIAFSVIAVSWGWGMRGTAIGGEKGAMLPGALLGLSFASFAGTDRTVEYYFIFTAAGAVGMYVGGQMTYGETLGLTMDSSPAPNMKRGMHALFIKGGAWFSVSWGCLFMTLSLVSRLIYDIKDVIAFFILLPVLSVIFTFLFNRPYDPETGKYPRVYFSKTRKETWGNVLAFTADIIIISAANRDLLTLAMTCAGFLTGGFGWMAAQYCQVRTKYPFKNGKYIFNSIHKYCLDSWKLMECVFGAVCGLGMSVCTIILMPNVTERLSSASWHRFRGFISPETDTVLGIIYLCLIALDSVQYLLKLKKTKAELAKMFSLSLLSREEYDRAVELAPVEQKKSVRVYQKICEYAEFPIYCIIPMLFIFIGSIETAKLVSFTVIFIVLSQELSFKLLKGIKNQRIWELFMYSIPLIFGILQFTNGYTPDIFLTMFVYTALYEAVYLVKRIWEFSLQKKTDNLKTFFASGFITHIYFCACCIILMVWAIFIK